MPRPQVNLSTVDLNLLLVFDAVMQERSVTRAGDAIGLSQSAVSHALRRLRHMLKDELFVRTPSGMIPTPRAEYLAGPVREALERLRQSLEPEIFDPATAESTFRIGVNNYSAFVLVAPIFADAARLAPKVMLQFHPIGPRGPFEQLDHHECDLVIGSHCEAGERFSVQPLLTDGYVVLMRKDHPAAAEDMSIQTFSKFGHLEVTSIDHSTDFIDQALAEHQLKRRIQLRASFISVARVMAVSDMVAVCPRYIAEELGRFRPLIFRELPFVSPSLATSMIWARQFDEQPAHKWIRSVIETITKAISDGRALNTTSMRPQ